MSTSDPQEAHPPPPGLFFLSDNESELSDLSSSDSELSSIASDMSTPTGYLSPVSSQGTVSRDSGDEMNKTKKKRSNTDGDDNAPVRKKRKSPEPRQRKRQDLDLRSLDTISEQDEQLQTLVKLLRNRRKIVVVAGAGISVSAGIPDFRSSTGLFKSLRAEHKLKGSGKALFDASVYQTEESTTSFHEMVRNLSTQVKTAKPTAFHRMLNQLSEEGRLMRLYTQNVDGIDTKMEHLQTSVPLPTKGPWPRAVQVHGGLEKMVCTKCHQLSDFEPRLFEGPKPPPCTTCVEADRVRTDHAGKRSHGIGCLRPRMVLYNEHNPDEEAIGSCMSADLRARPDALIVVGTSMKIPGVKRLVREMCGVVRSRRDGMTVWVNYDDPPTGPLFEDCWDVVVKGPCDEVARCLTMSNEQGSCSSSDVERAKDGNQFSVMVPPSPTKKVEGLGISTPATTPKQEPVKLATNPPRLLLKVDPKKVAAEKKQKRVQKDSKKAKPVPAKAKPAGPKKQTATTKKATNASLQNHFAVRKNGVAKAGRGKATAKDDPMGPVPNSDARLNAKIQPGKEISVEKTNAVAADSVPKTPLSVRIPVRSGVDYERRLPGGTISPSSVPKGMRDLLN